MDWERDYKWEAHRQWNAELSRSAFQSLLRQGKFREMALRDAVKSSAGAPAFAKGLFAFIYGPGRPERKFEEWCRVVAALPRK
ncbi:MAG: hypothetical protein ABI980_15950 [Nitrospirota bacterium]